MVEIKFMERVKSRLQELVGEHYEVTDVQVPRNNGVILSGLTLKKGKHGQMVPVIYLDEYFRQYQRGMSLNAIIDDIYKVAVQDWEAVMPDMKQVFNFEWARDKIAFRLVNWKKNRRFLMNAPYRRICDLAMIFYVQIGVTNYGKMTIPIDYECMKRWKVAEVQVYELAIKNTPLLEPMQFVSMNEIIPEIEEECSEEPIGCILTNQKGINGAGVMLYPGVLKGISEQLDGDLIIIPLSVHETMIFRYREGANLTCMQEMVKSTNFQEIAEEDVLSEEVYIYKRERGCIFMRQESKKD